jgi:hypothetical protein
MNIRELLLEIATTRRVLDLLTKTHSVPGTVD